MHQNCISLQVVTARPLPYLYDGCEAEGLQAQLRGALRGALAPVAMQTLVKELALEGLGPLHALLPSLIEQLLAEGGCARGWEGVQGTAQDRRGEPVAA